MLSSRSLALRRQLPSLVRHQSTNIPGWRQFSEDIRDAERCGTLRAPPSDHPLPPLWRCKELGLFYQRGIVKTWKHYQDAPGSDTRGYRASRARRHAITNFAKLTFCPLLPFAAFVPNSIFPRYCILPAQVNRYVEAALRTPPLEDILAAYEMHHEIGGLDFRRLDMGEPDQQEFWRQHRDTIIKLWPEDPTMFLPVYSRTNMFRDYLDCVAKEDELLRKRDLASLKHREVAEAVIERGMLSAYTSETEKRALLYWWLHEADSRSGTPEKMVATALYAHIHYIGKVELLAQDKIIKMYLAVMAELDQQDSKTTPRSTQSHQKDDSN
ncbi:hypothetical protein BDZ89DRAFT_1159194 [Hymenopellis radicata]|nr:hypothetical protein BDZ89DRAFT_1159194 [Hymenopellis radicata]